MRFDIHAEFNITIPPIEVRIVQALSQEDELILQGLLRKSENFVRKLERLDSRTK
jgi:hypothetical protein